MSEAFTRMRTHARRTGEPLTDVAEAVVAGTLDHGDLRPVPNGGDTPIIG